MVQSLPIVWADETNADAFEEARVGRVFNHRRPDRKPLAVVKATKESEIVSAVKLARERKCRVSVRSGGHSWAAWSVREGAILIDLGNYHFLEFDQENMTLVVSPSTTGRQLNSYLGERGFMFAGGHCPDVGLGGFLLQGGMGWNCKNWGWACENVLAIECVTADGELAKCDPSHHQDLFWAARGCGPGFPAVVTKYHLKVRKSYTNMLSSGWLYPVSKYKEVMDWVVKISEGYDEDTEIVAVGLTPETFGIHEVCIMPLFVTFKNSEAEAKAALSRANESRPEGFRMEMPDQPTSLANEYRNQAAANPQAHRYCAENAWISNGENVAEVLEDAFTRLPHPKAFSLWYSMNPISRRPNPPDMALSLETDHYFALYTIWEKEEDDKRCMKWVRDIMRKVEPHSEGSYLGDSDFQVRKTKFWKDANASRLMEIRRRYDPGGVICGYLDKDDVSGTKGLLNESSWSIRD
jgi:FAD/FMN-containing dehydrogenase